MRINRLSLLNSLFAVINENNQDDSYFILAHYFLEHYSELGNLNIYEVAEECFVSRASVRRFCQSIGYDNFKDLKTEVKEYSDEFIFHIEHSNRNDYRSYLTSEINAMIKELDERMNTQEVDRIVDCIHDSRYVVFLTSDTSTARVKEFQQSMILCGKIVRIISDMYTDNDLFNCLNEKDYLITISATGRFASAAEEIVKSSKAYRVLITVNRDEKFKGYYDRIYHLSAKDRSNEKTVYGKYGVDYMFDIIYSRYIQKYMDEVKKSK